MANTRITLENIENSDDKMAHEGTAILKFPFLLRDSKRTSKQYEGVPSLDIDNYRHIQEKQLGETA